jgi:predicted transcriptional regulator
MTRATGFAKEFPMAQTLLELAKDFVLAQMQVQVLSIDDMRNVLQHTHRSLMTLKVQEEGHGSGAGATSQRPLARGTWRTSITKHTVTCLECGARFKQLTVRHFRQHALDAASYRAKYGIPRTQPLAAKATTALRKQIAQATKPWENAPTYVTAQTRKATARKPRQGKRTVRAAA